MKRKRYTERHTVFAFQQAESGTGVAEICRKMGVAEATLYRRKKHCGGLDVTQIRRLRQPEDEYLQTGYGVSERRACQVLVSSRSTQRYQSVADRHEALRPDWSL